MTKLALALGQPLDSIGQVESDQLFVLENVLKSRCTVLIALFVNLLQIWAVSVFIFVCIHHDLIVQLRLKYCYHVVNLLLAYYVFLYT